MGEASSDEDNLFSDEGEDKPKLAAGFCRGEAAVGILGGGWNSPRRRYLTPRPRFILMQAKDSAPLKGVKDESLRARDGRKDAPLF